MFVYLIIAIELVVLYLVFWIVFLREPRPREIRAELWGSYFKPTDRSANNLGQTKQAIIDNGHLDFYLPSIVPPARLYRLTKMKKIRRKKIIIRRAQRWHLYCHLCSRHGSSHHSHQKSHLTQEASRTVVEKFLLSLNRVLNKLSVKVP
jgi:hypothetical protein